MTEGASCCTECAAGKFTSLKGQTACGTCNWGFFAPFPTAGCVGNCQAGTVSFTKGDACDAFCFAGTYSTIVGHCVAPPSNAGRCPLQCLAGTYSLDGVSTCTSCSAGFYSSLAVCWHLLGSTGCLVRCCLSKVPCRPVLHLFGRGISSNLPLVCSWPLLTCSGLCV